jgi:ubiquinone/menaquinone biosynthesis C-methylase UbiE
MDETENGVYKKIIETSFRENKEDFCPLRKEKQMDYLFEALAEDFKNKDLKILEAGCGYGRLLYFLNQYDQNQTYFGLDYVPELIKEGRKIFANNKNVNLECQDLMSLPDKYNNFFDISINYKTLSWLPYYETMLKQLVKVTKKKIFITSLFGEEDIDCIVKIYTNAQNNSGDSFSFLNTYSLPKFKKYCHSLGIKEINATNMVIDVDLPKPLNQNKLATYTVLTADRQRLEITNNIILSWKLIEIVL